MFLSSIKARLDQLEMAPETALNPDGTAVEFNVLKQEIVVLRASQEAVEDRFKNLLQAVADGIERVDRSERRIHATVKRARKELADGGLESPGLEAEANDLRLLDGGRSEEQGMPTVREELATYGGTPSSIPGVSREQLRAIRGM